MPDGGPLVTSPGRRPPGNGSGAGAGRP